MDFTFCDSTFINIPSGLSLGMYSGIPRLVLGVTLLIFAIIPTLKQSFEMHKTVKQWHPNKYVQQFVMDGILYFFV